MNKIKLKKMTVSNFKSFETLDFDFSKHHGLNYIFGVNNDIPGTNNGVGKSNIFDALLFALYGKTFHNNNNVYLPNRVVDKKLKTDVTLEFNINDDEYKVKSFIKHMRKPFTVNCVLEKNGEDITLSSSKETRAFIEKELLNCDYDLFKQSIILSSGEANNFFKMTKQQKRAYIEDIFDLTLFGKLFAMVKTDINNLDKEIIEKQVSIQQQRESIKDLKQKDIEFDDNVKIKINLLKKEVKEISKKIQKKDDKEFDVDKILKIKSDIKTQIDTLSTQTSSMIVKIKDNEYAIKSSKQSIDKHQEILDLVCCDCQKKINEKYEIQKYRDNIIEAEKQIDILTKSKNLVDKKVKLLNEKLSTIEQKLNVIDDFQQKQKMIDIENKQYKSRVLEIKKEIENQQKEENPFQKLIQKYENEIEEKNKLNKELQKEKTELDIIKYTLSEDGAKKYLIKDLVDILNQMIHKYLEEMGAEFTCVFDSNFEMQFLTHTGECEYNSFSAGERQRLNIATLLAFRDILMNGDMFEGNIFVLDELLDANVDGFCIQSVINILNRQVEDKDTAIFLISHREAIRPEEFDNIIELQKTNSITTIVKDSQR